MYYIGRFDGLPKTGVSGRQDLKITGFGQFQHLIFKNENGMPPPQQVGSSFVEESNPKFSAPKQEIN